MITCAFAKEEDCWLVAMEGDYVIGCGATEREAIGAALKTLTDASIETVHLALKLSASAEALTTNHPAAPDGAAIQPKDT